MEIIEAELRHINYIDWLRKSEGDALGFIPKQRYEMEITGERGGDIIIAKENNDFVGFAYITYGDISAKIQQIVIQEDARRMERATLLINNINNRAIKKGCAELGCRCADDLEANSFWQQLGFNLIGDATGKSVYAKGKAKLAKSKRNINIYRRLTGIYEIKLL